MPRPRRRRRSPRGGSNLARPSRHAERALERRVPASEVGGDAYPQAAFYSYAYPAPAGFDAAPVEPAGALWSTEMGEWLLPYEAVRSADDPDATLMRFLQTTYRAAADLGRWDSALECALGKPGRPRTV